MSKVRGRYRKLNIDRKWIILVLLAAIASIFINLWPLIFLSLFCILNAILLSIDRYVQMPVDIEISTFSAVLMTYSYGLNWGIAAAILTKLAAILYNKNVRVDHFFMMGGYVVAAMLANSLAFPSIIMAGIIIAFMVNLYVVFVSKFITMLSAYEILMYGTSNFIFNVVLFVGFADLFRLLMI